MTDIQEILSVLMYGCHAHPLRMLDGFAAVARPVVAPTKVFHRLDIAALA